MKLLTVAIGWKHASGVNLVVAFNTRNPGHWNDAPDAAAVHLRVVVGTVNSGEKMKINSLTVEEWVEYWREGNEQHKLDGEIVSDNLRSELAAVSAILLQLLNNHSAIEEGYYHLHRENDQLQSEIKDLKDQAYRRAMADIENGRA